MHLGIDFGTCFTSAAVLSGNQFRFVRDESGGNALPFYASAVCLTPEGELLLGTLARNMARKYPDRFRQEFKRDLGSDTPYAIGDKEFLPQDLIARLLARLKEEAEKNLDAIIPAAVLTVPASYDAHRRDLMVKAGVAAGFREDGVVLLDEPEAAALYYDWHRKQQGKPLAEGAVILVYDLGGGTFDAALMRKEGEKFRSLAPPVGDPHCGGIDFDRAIYKEVLAVAESELQELLAPENVSNPARRMKLQIAEFCREVKHQLTRRSQVEDVLPGPGVEDFALTRTTFDQKITPYVDRTIELCRELVAASGCSWDEVSGILMIGGSSRISYVGTRLTEAFHRPLWQVDEPQMAVCMGAAVHPSYHRVLKSASLERVAKTNPMLASGRGKMIDLWDSSTGELLRTFTGHAEHVYSVALSPNGKVLASGSGTPDSTVKLWDSSTGKLIQTLTGHLYWINSVAFSPDGTILASASTDIKLWDSSTGKPIRTLTDSESAYGWYSVTFSPDGKVLATGSDDRNIGLWDTMTGELIRTLTGHSAQIRSVAFSPDGKMLATGSLDKTIKLWNSSKGELPRTLTGHASGISSVVFSPDGKILFSGSADNTIKLWSVSTGELIRTFIGHTGDVADVALSPDGKMIASSSYDKTIKLWDIATGEPVRTIPVDVSSFAPLAYSSAGVNSASGHSRSVGSLIGSSNGRILASGSDDQTIKLWEPETGNVIENLGCGNGAIRSLAFAHDGSTLVSSDNGLGFWDRASQQRTEPPFGPTKNVHGVAASPDGKLIATASEDAILCLWDTTTHELVHVFYGHRAKVYSVVFSPDSNLLYSASDDHTLKVWNVPERKQLATLDGHEAGVRFVAISSDGKTIASASDDRTVRLWDTTSCRPIHVLTGHTDAVHSVAFSDDGSTLASAGADQTIHLWNVATGDPLETLTGHEETVNAVLFAAQDTRLVSASDDRSVRFWKLEWA